MLSTRSIAKQFLKLHKGSYQKIFVNNNPLTNAIPYFCCSFLPNSRFSRNIVVDHEHSFFKLHGHSPLRMKLHSAKSMEEILSIFQIEPFSFNKDETIISIQKLTQLLKSSEYETLEHDERYEALSKKVSDYIGEMDETEINDVLVWIRKFNAADIPTYMPEEDIDKLFNKAMRLISNNKINFNQTVNIFLSFSSLKRNTGELGKKLFYQMKMNPKLLIKGPTLQLLQACLHRENYVNYQIADYICLHIEKILDEYNDDERAALFEHFAKLELYVNPPRYKIPKIMFVLGDQLCSMVEKLSISSLFRIIEAYEFVPISYSTYLLNRVKASFVHRIQNNKKIESSVLCSLLEKIAALRKNARFDDNEFINIYKELMTRISKDPYFNSLKHIKKLIESYENNPTKFDPLIHKIYSKVLESSNPMIAPSLYLCFLHSGIDIRKLLDIHASSSQATTVQGAVKILLGYSLLKDPQLTPKMDELRKVVLQADIPQLVKVIATISENFVINPYIEQMIIEINQRIKNKKAEIEEEVLFKVMFRSCQNANTRKFWIDYAEKNFPKMSKESLTNMIDVYFGNRDIHTFDQIILFHRIFEIVDPQNIPLKKLITTINHDRKYLLDISWLDVIFARFTSNLRIWIDIHKKDFRCHQIFTFVKRMDHSGAHANSYSKVLKKFFEISKEIAGNSHSTLNANFASYMMEKNLLSIEDAHKLFQHTKSLKNKLSEPKVLSYILINSPKQSDVIISAAMESLANIEKLLTTEKNDIKTTLTLLAAVLRFPPILIDPKKNLYLEQLKEALRFANHDTYTQIMEAIPDKYLEENVEFYEPFINEILQNYSYASTRMLPTQLVTLLQKLSIFGSIDPLAYNLIMVDIDKWFHSFKADQLHSIVKALVRLRKNESVLFDKILKKISSGPINYLSKIGDLVHQLFIINHKSEVIQKFMSTIFKNDVYIRGSNIFSILAYIIVLNFPNERELIGEIMLKMKDYYSNQNQRLGVELYDYFKIYYKDKPEWAEAIKSIVVGFDKECLERQNQSSRPTKNKEILRMHLETMNVEFKENVTINGLQTDFYLPSQKAVIKILTNGQFDETESVIGPVALRLKILESLKDMDFILVNLSKLRSFTEFKDKTQYLQDCGINMVGGTEKKVKLEPEDLKRYLELERYFEEEDEAQDKSDKSDEEKSEN